MTSWKSATCERCTFRVGVVCRRFPPSNNKDYPYVAGKEDGMPIIYEQACAEYTEEGQPTPFELAAKLAVDKGAVAAMDAMAGSVSKPLTTYDVAEEAWKAT